ncbi:MAG: hypothetical protein ACTSV2_15760 [Candidatus Thorarchaeota archaeon]
MFQINRIVKIQLLLVLIIGISSPVYTETALTDQFDLSSISTLGEDLTGIRVAVYQSYRLRTDERVNASRLALFNMFSWMNASVEIINRTDILNGALFAFEVLATPSGVGNAIQANLGEDAMDRIKEWVSLGGTYIGVRGSSTITCTDGYFEGDNETFYMDFINTTAIGMHDFAYITIANLTLNMDIPNGPDLSMCPPQMGAYWRNGRYFEAGPDQELITIATYDYNDKPAIVAAEYGLGNVFASSPQIEFEENNDRDGTDYVDEYDDPESDWPFMFEMSKWLLEKTPTVANISSWSYTPPLDTTEHTSSSVTQSEEPIHIGTIVAISLVGCICTIALIVLQRKRS